MNFDDPVNSCPIYLGLLIYKTRPWISEYAYFWCDAPSGLDMVPDIPLPGLRPRLTLFERFALIILFCLFTIPF